MASLPPPIQRDGSGFVTRPLSGDDLAQAYALVGLWHREVSLERWRQHVARGQPTEPLTWTAIRDGRDYIHGIFSHRVETDLVEGRVLLVSDILTAGFSARATLMAMLQAVDRLAASLCCPVVRILLHPERSDPDISQIRQVFCERGFADRGPYLSRRSPLPVT